MAWLGDPDGRYPGFPVGQQFAGEIPAGFVGHLLPGLGLYGRDNFRVAVADIHHTNAAGKIKEFVAFHVFENSALA